MSCLIDIVRREWTTTEIEGRWYVAKPENDKREFKPFFWRIKDAWRVLWCKSTAFHYKEDVL